MGGVARKGDGDGGKPSTAPRRSSSSRRADDDDDDDGRMRKKSTSTSISRGRRPKRKRKTTAPAGEAENTRVATTKDLQGRRRSRTRRGGDDNDDDDGGGEDGKERSKRGKKPAKLRSARPNIVLASPKRSSRYTELPSSSSSSSSAYSSAYSSSDSDSSVVSDDVEDHDRLTHQARDDSDASDASEWELEGALSDDKKSGGANETKHATTTTTTTMGGAAASWLFGCAGKTKLRSDSEKEPILKKNENARHNHAANNARQHHKSSAAAAARGRDDKDADADAAERGERGLNMDEYSYYHYDDYDSEDDDETTTRPHYLKKLRGRRWLTVVAMAAAMCAVCAVVFAVALNRASIFGGGGGFDDGILTATPTTTDAAAAVLNVDEEDSRVAAVGVAEANATANATAAVVDGNNASTAAEADQSARGGGKFSWRGHGGGEGGRWRGTGALKGGRGDADAVMSVRRRHRQRRGGGPRGEKEGEDVADEGDDGFVRLDGDEDEKEERLVEREVDAVEWEPDEPDPTLHFSRATVGGRSGKRRSSHSSSSSSSSSASKKKTAGTSSKMSSDVAKTGLSSSKGEKKSRREKASEKESSEKGGGGKTTSTSKNGAWSSNRAGKGGEEKEKDKSPLNGRAAMDALLNLPLLGTSGYDGTATQNRLARLGDAGPSGASDEKTKNNVLTTPNPARTPAPGLAVNNNNNNNNRRLGSGWGWGDDEEEKEKEEVERAKTKRKYLIGLTTSAGFGDQFMRLSAYAEMASDLNRTLVMWPVFTSPHAYNNGNGVGGGKKGPLRFSDYVRITGPDAVDAPGRVVAYSDVPESVRSFPVVNPSSCVTSNYRPNPVQFFTSANEREAVVAPANQRTPYGALVSSLIERDRRNRDRDRDSNSGAGKNNGNGDEDDEEVLCVAATFSAEDYAFLHQRASRRRRQRQQGGGGGGSSPLDFVPEGRFHQYWARAVKAMSGVGNGNVSGVNEGAGGDEKDAVARLGVLVRGNRDVAPFHITPEYTALHWRRGDKCAQTARGGGGGGVKFDTSVTALALMCGKDEYTTAKVLDLCRVMRPMYVATDDEDPAFLAHLRSKGCLISADLQLGVPRESLDDVEKLMVDVMLVAGAKLSFTFGHSALTKLYDDMRLTRGATRSIRVRGGGGGGGGGGLDGGNGNDSEAFKATYDAAMAAAAAGSAAAGAGAGAGA